MNAIRNQPAIATKSWNEQWKRLIAQPLMKIPTSFRRPIVTIVVDALDECDNDNDMKEVIAILAQAKDVASVRLRILITSRPETSILTEFRRPEIIHQSLLLHNEPRDIVDGDICLYFYSAFETIKRTRYWLADSWPSVDTVNQLVHLSGGLFIFAATVCRFIEEEDEPADDSLSLFLQQELELPRLDEDNESRGRPTFFLDEMYLQILERSTRRRQHEAGRSKTLSSFREMLGAIAALIQPLPIIALARLLGVREGDIHQRLNRLHSVVSISTSPETPVRLLHASFRDFLFDRNRCHNAEFYINPQEAHRRLLWHCIKVMEAALRPDICNLQRPGSLRSEVSEEWINMHIPGHVQYACSSWVNHLALSGVPVNHQDRIYTFLQTHFLHWIEVLSWIGRTALSIGQIRLLRSLVTVSNINNTSIIKLSFEC